MSDLDACIQPPLSAQCMNPGCSNTCAWPETRRDGRPSRFCHRRCQEKFERARTRLTEEIRIIEGIDLNALDREPRLYLANQLARRRWLLERYPALRGLPHRPDDEPAGCASEYDNVTGPG